MKDPAKAQQAHALEDCGLGEGLHTIVKHYRLSEEDYAKLSVMKEINKAFLSGLIIPEDLELWAECAELVGEQITA